MATSEAPKGDLFYAPKPVPPQLSSVVKACIDGDVDTVKFQWKPHLMDVIRRLGREDTGLPLLNAAHHLRVEVVEFLLQQGLSPRQRGTVHPYTGDSMTVAELQGINSLELISKMLFMHPRKSRRRDAIVAVQKLLVDYDAKLGPLGSFPSSTPNTEVGRPATNSPGAMAAAAVATTPGGAGGLGDRASPPAPTTEPSDAALQPSAMMTRTMTSAALDTSSVATPAADAKQATGTPGSSGKELLSIAKGSSGPEAHGPGTSPAVRPPRASPGKDAAPTPIPLRGWSSPAPSSTGVKKPRRPLPATGSDDASAFSSVGAAPKRQRTSDTVETTMSAGARPPLRHLPSEPSEGESDGESYVSEQASPTASSDGQDADLSNSYVLAALNGINAVEKCLALDAVSAVQTRIPKAVAASVGALPGDRAVVVVGGPPLRFAKKIMGSAGSLSIQNFASLRNLVNACNAALEQHRTAAVVPEAEALERPRSASRDFNDLETPPSMGYRYAYGYGRTLAQSVMSALSFAAVRSRGSPPKVHGRGAPAPFAILPARVAASPLGISPHMAVYPDIAKMAEFSMESQSSACVADGGAPPMEPVPPHSSETPVSGSQGGKTEAQESPFAQAASPSSFFSSGCPVACGVFFSPMSLSAPSIELFIQPAITAHRREASLAGSTLQGSVPSSGSVAPHLKLPRLRSKLYDVVMGDAVARRAKQLFEPFGHAFRSMVGSMVTTSATCVMMVLCRPAANPEAFPVDSIFATSGDGAGAAHGAPTIDVQSAMLAATAQDLWSATMSLVLRSFGSASRQLLSAAGQPLAIDTITVETVALGPTTTKLLSQKGGFDASLREYLIVTVGLVPSRA